MYRFQINLSPVVERLESIYGTSSSSMVDMSESLCDLFGLDMSDCDDPDDPDWSDDPDWPQDNEEPKSSVPAWDWRYEEVGDRMRTLRKRAGVTTLDMCRRARVSTTTLNCWERGMLLPSNAKLDKWCLALDLDADTAANLQELREKARGIARGPAPCPLVECSNCSDTFVQADGFPDTECSECRFKQRQAVKARIKRSQRLETWAIGFTGGSGIAVETDRTNSYDKDRTLTQKKD